VFIRTISQSVLSVTLF